MQDLLFSPNGRIGKALFLKGILYVAAAYALFYVITYFISSLAFITSILGILLFVPFIFLFIKRSHDGGKSGWLSLLWLFVWALIVLVFYMVGAVLLEGALLQEYFGLIMEAAAEGDVQAQNEIKQIYGEKLRKAIGVKLVPFGFIATMTSAYLINAIVGADAYENQYGPVPRA